MPRAAASCNEAITAPTWPAQGRPIFWGLIWISMCLHTEEVRPDLLQEIHHASRKKVNFPHTCLFPCSSVTNRATVKHQSLFWVKLCASILLEALSCVFHLSAPLPTALAMEAECLRGCQSSATSPLSSDAVAALHPLCC